MDFTGWLGSAHTRTPTEENSSKTMPTTNANFTTIRRVHTSFNDQTNHYPLRRTISLAYTTDTQRILAPQQDQAAEEPEIGTSKDPLTSIEDWYSDSETPIHQVQPVLGMTPTENLQLRDRN